MQAPEGLADQRLFVPGAHNDRGDGSRAVRGAISLSVRHLMKLDPPFEFGSEIAEQPLIVRPEMLAQTSSGDLVYSRLALAWVDSQPLRLPRRQPEEFLNPSHHCRGVLEQ